MPTQDEPGTDLPPRRRPRRIGLYGPFLLLALLAVGWSVAWLLIRERAASGLDEWIAAEASAGRRWSCADRHIGGYPFRIEIACSDFTVDRPDVHASIGRLLVVSQIYQPRHIIAEASGPLRIQAGPTKVEGDWRQLQASVILRERGFDRISLVAEMPKAAMQNFGAATLDLASRRFEAHLRPDPAAPATFDLVMRSDGAVIPGLDALVGGEEPADLQVGLEVTETDDLPARPLWNELERWRVVGGRVELRSFGMVKGPRRAEATGTFGIDAEHRVEGRLQIAALGLGGLLGRLADGSGIGGALIGALLGTPEPAVAPKGAAPGLRPLPPLRLDGGRVFVGPLAIPGIRLPPLY
ncbi:DUF2125 domain-containing protein [Enterovirga sp.]|jgi:hypothetical protein|uniref:DUF2125 domain-containing protein n=1 Tax=Enterovirga sp. TaxID=2026350 RepID=UPI0026247839|nr:DUF2125 domain-containing protein [Enterovirga sp.]MDB5591627.1 hypothetical protein [Enterovirga sp.]